MDGELVDEDSLNEAIRKDWKMNIIPRIIAPATSIIMSEAIRKDWKRIVWDAFKKWLIVAMVSLKQ